MFRTPVGHAARTFSRAKLGAIHEHEHYDSKQRGKRLAVLGGILRRPGRGLGHLRNAASSLKGSH